MKCRLFIATIIFILTVLTSFAPNLLAAPSPDQVRAYVKATYGLADVTDQVLDTALGKSPISGSRDFLNVFGFFITADNIVNDLYQGNYTDAIGDSSFAGIEWAISDTFLGQTLASPMSVASLATLPIQYSLNAFVDQIEKNSWDTQVKLYIAARRAGMSHDAIMLGNDDNARGVVFFNGWLFLVGDLRVPPLGQISPTGYTKSQVYGAAQQEYEAVNFTALYQRDKDIVGTEFKKMLNPGITLSPMYPTAPADVFFVADPGSVLSALIVTSYSWDFGDGQIGSGASISHFYKNIGPYYVTLTMTDGNGGTHTAYASVNIQPPPIIITYPDGYESLHRVYSTVDNMHVTEQNMYMWDFGDGTPTTTGLTADHVYSASGSYTVTLTLTLDDSSIVTSEVRPFIGPGTRIIQGHTIYGNETWYSGGTYVIENNNLYVAAGATLTIEPGVTVKVGTADHWPYGSWGVSVIVEGTLNANNVIFTSADGSTRWGPIQFNGHGSDNSKLLNSVIEYADLYVCLWLCEVYDPISNILITNSSPFIDGCVIKNSSGGGISINNGSPIITNNTISGPDTGINVYNGSYPLIKNNQLISNAVGININTFFPGGYPYHQSGGIYQNNILNNNGVGITVDYSSTISSAAIFENKYSNNLYADINASGQINTKIEWNEASALNYLVSSLSIVNNGKLYVSPGKTVRFSPSNRYYSGITTLGGDIIAKDTKFTSDDGNDSWTGINFFAGGSNSIIDNCVIEHIQFSNSTYVSDSWCGYAICITHGCINDQCFGDQAPTISNSTLNAFKGIYIGSAKFPSIINNTINGLNGTGTGLYIDNTGTPNVTSNSISGFNNGVYIEKFGGGVYNDNKIINNLSYGIYYSGSKIIDAIDNDWGDISGPLDNSDDRLTGGLYNPNGKGNKVSNKVKYYPWTGCTIGQTAIPSNLTSTPADRSVILQWDTSSEPALNGYNIYYGTSPGSYGSPLMIGKFNTYTITGLTNGISYYIALSSVNTIGGESAKTPELSVTLPTFTLMTYTAGTGIGTVMGGGMYNEGAIATVTATPYAGSTFVGWSGDCSGTEITTTVTMNSNKTCTATFSVITGSISGVVSDDSIPANRLAGVPVSACIGSTNCVSTLTGPDGSYSIANLNSGTYTLTAGGGGSLFAQAYYPNNTHNPYMAGWVNVNGNNVQGVDFVLQHGGIIAGIVSGGSGTGLPGIRVQACTIMNDCGDAVTNNLGEYAITILPDSYTIYADAYGTPYVGEFYDNTYDRNMATSVTTSLGNIMTANIMLDLPGSISGKIKDDATGQGISGIWVNACTPSGFTCNGAMSDMNGDYTIIGLVPTNHQVYANGNGDYIGRYYGDVYDAALSSLVPVASGNTVSGIDIDLQVGGSISGFVMASDTGLGITGVWIYVCPSTGMCMNTSTDMTGYYKISGLNSGSYSLFAAGYGSAYLSKYYASTGGTQDPASAEPVLVTLGNETASKNFVLDISGSISGTVSSATGSLSWMWIYACTTSGGQCWNGPSNIDGTYTISGLVSGTYMVYTYGNGIYATQYYNSVAYQAAATPVTVIQGQNTAGVNFILTEVPPPFNLTVTKAGNGTGMVTADQGTIIWSGPTGTAAYSSGATMHLTAVPDSGSTFLGWDGCDSLTGNICTVTVTSDRGVIATFNQNVTVPVTTGSNVLVTATPPGSDQLVTTTFTTVTNSGNLTVTPIPTPAAPANFSFIGGTSYEITSTAGYTPPITVCIGYDPAKISVAQTALRLLHRNGTIWDDITLQPVDILNHRVCGLTNSLSPFVIAQPIKPGDCDGDGKVSIAEVQSAINMYLGLKTVAACVDTDGNGSVSIAEVQKVINGYLGL